MHILTNFVKVNNEHLCCTVSSNLFLQQLFLAVTVPGHPSHQCSANQSNPSQLIQFSHRSCQTKLAPLHFSTKK